MSSTGERTSTVILREIVKKKFLNEESVSINIFTAFTMVGICSALFFNNSDIKDLDHGLYGPASILVWSYLTALISLGCILLIRNVTNPSFMFSGTSNIGGLATLFLMIWIVSLNLKHFKKINMDVVPKSFYNYSGMTSLLLVVQSIFIFLTLDNNPSQNEDEFKVLLSRISILKNVIIFLTFVLVLIQQIILDKFSVDVL